MSYRRSNPTYAFQRGRNGRYSNAFATSKFAAPANGQQFQHDENEPPPNVRMPNRSNNKSWQPQNRDRDRGFHGKRMERDRQLSGRHEDYDEEKSVFVGNVPTVAGITTVRQHFAQFGPIENIFIKTSQTSHTFAFIKFKTKQAVRNALMWPEPMYLDNNLLAIKPRQKPSNDQPGSYGRRAYNNVVEKLHEMSVNQQTPETSFDRDSSSPDMVQPPLSMEYVQQFPRPPADVMPLQLPTPQAPTVATGPVMMAHPLSHPHAHHPPAPPPPPPPPPQSRVVRIAGIPGGWTPSTLFAVFMNYGKVRASYIYEDKDEFGKRQGLVQLQEDSAEFLAQQVKQVFVQNVYLQIYPSELKGLQDMSNYSSKEKICTKLTEPVSINEPDMVYMPPRAPHPPPPPPFMMPMGYYPHPPPPMHQAMPQMPVSTTNNNNNNNNSLNDKPASNMTRGANSEIFIKHLDPTLIQSDDDLKLLFCIYGEIQRANLCKDADNKSRMFGFVEFVSLDSATSAVEGMNRKTIGDQQLYVKYSSPSNAGSNRG